jgi:hypothetical protein
MDIRVRSLDNGFVVFASGHLVSGGTNLHCSSKEEVAALIGQLLVSWQGTCETLIVLKQAQAQISDAEKRYADRALAGDSPEECLAAALKIPGVN